MRDERLEGLSLVDRKALVDRKTTDLQLSSLSSVDVMVGRIRAAIADCQKTPQRCQLPQQAKR